jgi:hypothetical protein
MEETEERWEREADCRDECEWEWEWDVPPPP